MSNISTTENFYVDFMGNERPIRYKASDLVNKPAPDGYFWAGGHPWYPHPSEGIGTDLSCSLNGDKDDMGLYNYYVAVKKENQ